MNDEATIGEVTQILASMRDGDRGRVNRLFELVYAELHRIARAQRRSWSGQFTMNTTSLIHEAFLKLARPEAGASWTGRNHFFAVAAKAMRQVLVNYARERKAAKRGDGKASVSLDDADVGFDATADEVVALHEALSRLEQLHERQARVVECRFFAGLEVEETAEALGVSPITIKRDWRAASAWLHRELSRGPKLFDGPAP